MVVPLFGQKSWDDRRRGINGRQFVVVLGDHRRGLRVFGGPKSVEARIELRIEKLEGIFT